MSIYIDFFSHNVMEWGDIKNIVPQETAKFEECLVAAGMDLDEFCEAYSQGEFDEGDTILDAWDNLNTAFTKATRVETAGLELEPVYDDDLDDDNAFFSVLGVDQLTPAGAKFKDKIEQKHFTSFG
jgi:hypothetical protein